MSLKKNLYRILNISPTASESEIKAAFRKLAKQYHPDKNSSKLASVNFQKIKAAYEVLGNSKKRSLYDLDNPEFFRQKPRSPTKPHSKSEKGINLKYQLTIPLERAMAGCTKSLVYIRQSEQGPTEQKVSVDIPSGVHDGQRLRVQYMGDEGKNGGTPGDLIVIINVENSPLMQNKGSDLFIQIPLKYSEAVLGTKFSFSWRGNSLKIDVPPLIDSNYQVVFEGKGLAAKNTGEPGRLIFKFIIEVPQNISENCSQELKGFFKNFPTTSLRKEFEGYLGKRT